MEPAREGALILKLAIFALASLALAAVAVVAGCGQAADLGEPYEADQLVAAALEDVDAYEAEWMFKRVNVSGTADDISRGRLYLSTSFGDNAVALEGLSDAALNEIEIGDPVEFACVIGEYAGELISMTQCGPAEHGGEGASAERTGESEGGTSLFIILAVAGFLLIAIIGGVVLVLTRFTGRRSEPLPPPTAFTQPPAAPTVDMGATAAGPADMGATAAGPAGGAGGTVATAASPSATMAMQPDIARTMAWVVVTRGPSEGKSIQLKEGNNTIGRALDSDLQIDDASVSRSHAMVSVKGEEFTLIDLGSASGTRIGEYSIAGRRVSAGSEIAVGNTRLGLINVDVTHGAPSSGDTIVGTSSGHSLALIAQSGPDAGRSFPLPSAQNIIGRDPTAQVSLSDPTVSRRHAMVRVGADRTTISDLGSMSGTAVNGEVIKGVRISAGDRIVVGQSEFTLMKPSV